MDNKKATLEDILPGYKSEYETTTQNTQLYDIFGVDEEDFKFIIDVCEMFFLSEPSLSMCIKKALELIQEKKNMISHGHAITVLSICVQVRERYQTITAFHAGGPNAMAMYQSATIVKAMGTATSIGLSDYFNERLAKRLSNENRSSKKDSVVEEAERAIDELLGRKRKGN